MTSITVTAWLGKDGCLHMDNKEQNLKSDVFGMKSFGLKIPSGRYRVTYYLNPHGRLRVFFPGLRDLSAIQLAGDSENGLWAHACFLPGLDWEGKRVSRVARRITT